MLRGGVAVAAALLYSFQNVSAFSVAPSGSPLQLQLQVTRGFAAGPHAQLFSPGSCHRSRYSFTPCHKHKLPRVICRAGSKEEEEEVDTFSMEFDAKTTATLIAGQASLMGASVVAASVLGMSNFGLGDGFVLNQEAIVQGILCTLPLWGLAFGLDLIESRVPALQDVSKATQRSVLAILGDQRRPLEAIVVCVALGVVAGIGEEWLFRGVLQTSLGDRIGVGPSLGLTSIVFGALHAVTPLYAALATIASLYFGYLYIGVSSSANDLNNLAMPMVCHGFYDVLALLWAHYTVTNMSAQEQYELATWEPSSPPKK